jgi:uncharacterized protein
VNHNSSTPEPTDQTEVMPEGLAYEDLVDFRFSRRTALKATAVLGAAAALPAMVVTRAAAQTPAATSIAPITGFITVAAATIAESLVFAPIAAAPVTDDQVRVPAGYVVDIIAKWGDGIFPDSPAFNADTQTAASQARQVGYNHDFQAFFENNTAGTAGTLFINHEYTDATRMIPGYDRATTDNAKLKGWVDIELEAHGGTVVELARSNNTSAWKINKEGKRNRRITANTRMVFSGPAARDARLIGGATGMLNNCGGGRTPWGTVLTAEENFNQYFGNVDKMPNGVSKDNYRRMGLNALASDRQWEKVYPDRFDTSINIDEAMKHGWIVEIDPDDASSVPVKHTAMGRFKHEAATVVVADNGQVVVYSGDDERFEFFYKYVSYGFYDAKLGKKNSQLLTEGTLHVAKLNADGTAEWIPLVFGSRPELSAPRFSSQSDILLRTREAGTAVGATKMDRPEDVETNPKTGKVYVALTNNGNRRTVTTDEAERAANPRFSSVEGNRTGHLLELTETSKSGHAGKSFKWDIFMLAGDPGATGASRVTSASKAVGSRDLYFGGFTGAVSPIGSPDNVAFSPDGMLWVATDGAPGSVGFNDALHAVPTTGPKRGQVLQFLSVPAGAETCGPEFSADQKTLFIAVQHPGEDAAIANRNPKINSQSSWPDGPGTQPRPASIAIRKVDGGIIGQ